MHKKSTKLNYYTSWCLFNKFIICLDKRADKWEDHLVLFVAHLIGIKTQSGTIKSYTSAIKLVLKLDGIVLEENFLLAALMHACKLTNDRVKARLPISKNMLRVMLDKLEMIYEDQPYLECLFKAVLVTGYYGMMRVGEIADGPPCLKVVDIHNATNKFKLQLVLYSSKTHGRGDAPQIIKISSIADKGVKTVMDKDCYCPFKIISRYVAIRDDFELESEPFFIFRDGNPLKARHVHNILQLTITMIGLDSYMYDTHSLRIGRASDLMKMGTTVDSIKSIGRWRSNAVYRYIHK